MNLVINSGTFFNLTVPGAIFPARIKPFSNSAPSQVCFTADLIASSETLYPLARAVFL